MRRVVLCLVCLALAGTAFAVDRVGVPSDGRPVTLDGLQVGGTYQLRVSGTMVFGRWPATGRTLQNDACFEYAAKGYPDPLTTFQNSFGVIVCGPYRSDHTYVSAPFVAPSERLVLWVFDTDYRDNGGVLDVEIIPVPVALESGYCILRKPDLFGPPNCFEFYLADADRTAGALAVIDGGVCGVTDLGLRQGWRVDPTLGGPYVQWEAADSSMNVLSRYGGDLYRCLAADGTEEDDDGGGLDDDSCPWAFDGECDEPGIGTGVCLAGTDTFDCSWVRWGLDDSCPWAFDGECDEPGIGTGVCLAGTDSFDCRGGDTPTDDDLPDDVERREQQLTQCDVWSVANSGGVEGTVDRWDVSTVPGGASFDLRFEAYQLPDRFRVGYGGAAVYESGWRGESRHGSSPDYPGGVVGPGAGEALDMFVKGLANDFTVTVVGVDPQTEWQYSVRCRLP
jgi:hypothetical protein